jgi:signal peptidase II
VTARLNWPSLLLGVFALLFDRGHKFIQLDVLGGVVGGPVPLLPIIDYTYVENTGVSYNLFSELPVWALAGLAAVAVAGMLVWWWRSADPLVRTGLMLIIGGALSNAIDRMVYGGVADFFRLHWGDMSFFVFNIADVAISAGVVLLAADVLGFGRPKSS